MNRYFAPLFLFCASFWLTPLAASAITINTVPVGKSG